MSEEDDTNARRDAALHAFLARQDEERAQRQPAPPAQPEIATAALPPSGPAPASGVPKWIIASLLGAGLVIVVLLVVVIVLLVSGGKDSSSPAAATKSSGSATSKTFSVKGDITLIDSGVNYVGNECFGTGGYDDMHGGTQVVVKDATGTTVAVGELDAGTKQSSVECYFSFSVDAVPSGGAAYSLEVSHRGSYSFTEADATSISLSLG